MIDFHAQVSHYKARTTSRDTLNESSRPNEQRMTSKVHVSADKLALLAFFFLKNMEGSLVENY